MRPLKEFGPELDKLLDSLKSNDKDDLRGSLRKAKAAARSVGIYSREKGSGSYHTIKAALDSRWPCGREDSFRQRRGIYRRAGKPPERKRVCKTYRNWGAPRWLLTTLPP